MERIGPRWFFVFFGHAREFSQSNRFTPNPTSFYAYREKKMLSMMFTKNGGKKTRPRGPPPMQLFTHALKKNTTHARWSGMFTELILNWCHTFFDEKLFYLVNRMHLFTKLGDTPRPDQASTFEKLNRILNCFNDNVSRLVIIALISN